MEMINKTRPYYTVDDYYKQKFGTKVFKIPLNGNFSCPNRDGTLSDRGCLFCSELASGEFAGARTDPLDVQYREILSRMRQKWPEGKRIVYFQANTNTYAPVDRLRSLYEYALSLDPEIVGLSIATRPDCLSDDTLDYLHALNDRTFLTVELGLQTIHESTSELINRHHTLSAFDRAVMELRKRNIHTVVHIINGLPGETETMMLETSDYLNRLDIQGIKIHMLFIANNAPIYELYKKGMISLLDQPTYVKIVATQIEKMRPDLIIYRLTGDPDRNTLVAPQWTLKKFSVTNDIDKYLRSRGSYQGVRYHD